MIKTNNPEIDVEELMHRIRDEVAQRKAASCMAEDLADVEKPRFSANVEKIAGEEIPAFKLNLQELSPFAVQPAFEAKADGQYHVNDLLCYHDQGFVNVAYRTVLRRSPDTNGCLHYLNMLRNGCAKIDILGRLRYSKEGREVEAKISGLALPFLLQQVYRIPFFGRFVQILSAIWHLPQLERSQRTFENHTLLFMEQAIRQLQDFAAQLVGQVAVNEAHNNVLSRIQKSLDVLHHSKVGLDSIDHIMAQIQALQNFKANQSALDTSLLQVKDQIHDINGNILDQDRRLRMLLEEVRIRHPEPISKEQIQNMDAMYASFEDQFRGTSENIKKYQSVYLPYIRNVGAGTAEAPIVDLGCGRGEWLELLRDESLVAKGIDLNRVFIGACRDLDLDVVEQDAVACLRSLKSDSIGVITAFHLIEHLTIKTLIELLDESLRVLMPGGLVILETPNPENLLVGSCYFYMDPTHQKPLPFQLCKFLLEARGFIDLIGLYLHPFENINQSIVGDSKLAEIVNRYLFGPRDFAVIGKKP